MELEMTRHPRSTPVDQPPITAQCHGGVAERNAGDARYSQVSIVLSFTASLVEITDSGPDLRQRQSSAGVIAADAVDRDDV